ncbi:DUF5060 domain-containing protein [Flammeovirga yaeyamensis]|uniref:DUF5060 domain-containing protein n=1 Tax=Flammeovirga yaeyamensis TaxID=367791 RepID=A0AAX1N6F9_9BACT|nr:T9SS type A sorting domain-containing protein [Flammeovirga yaeyamensis]MBB3698237.1 hypothetical protein [Flammeovirga yaeyamensis]NMF34408.1 DUF5060 domain-containing protein [Flammeovirga yaeyamensis]QWG01388.1 DUF5060 domain-containing protein [Flammeovirga yaeyamensis]
MKFTKLFTLLFFVIHFTLTASTIQPEIIEITNNTTSLSTFEKFESIIKVKAEYTNPYDPQDIDVSANIKLPDGTTVDYPLFYKGVEGGVSEWGLRIAPKSEGSYSFTIKVITGDQNTTSEEQTFSASDSEGLGFLHTVNNNFNNLVFDNGSGFRGFGLNMAWEARNNENPKYTYEFWFDLFADHDINFVRTWVNAPWNLPIEWSNPTSDRYGDYDGIGYHPEGLERIEYMINEAEKNEMYLMLAMDFHGALWVNNNDGWGNNFWNVHPYKELAGCVNPNDFFTFEEARRLYKNRLRYFVARWGYSTSVAAIEFFNEVDNTIIYSGQNVNPADVVEWHGIMGDYLKSIDYHNHILTTSISHNQINGLFDVDELDMIQSHLYDYVDNMAQVITDMTNTHKKPYVVGEMGLDFMPPNNNDEAKWIKDLQKTMWLGMFEKTSIIPMTWWWENYEVWNAYNKFEFLSEYTEKMTTNSDSERTDLSFINSEDLNAKGILIRNRHGYVFVEGNGTNLRNITLQIDGLPENDYTFYVYNAYTYELKDEIDVSASASGKFYIELKDISANEDIFIYLENKRGDITGVEDDLKKVGWNLYPNPVKSTLNYKIDDVFNPINAQFFIYDLNGKVMAQAGLEQNSNINLDAFPSGMYIFKIVSDSFEDQKLFIKQ